MMRYSRTSIPPSWPTVTLLTKRVMCHSRAKAEVGRQQMDRSNVRTDKTRVPHPSRFCLGVDFFPKSFMPSASQPAEVISELHRYGFTLRRIRDVEELLCLDVEHPRHDVARKRLNLGIEITHHGVVVASRVLNGVFQPGQRALQRLELLRSLQLRIGFGDRQQPAQGVGQLALGLALFRRSGSGHGGAAELGNVFERALFVRRIALHGLDQVWDQVITALELDIDIRPGVVGSHSELHQAVVNTYQDNGNDHQYDDEDDDSHANCLQTARNRDRAGGYHAPEGAGNRSPAPLGGKWVIRYHPLAGFRRFRFGATLSESRLAWCAKT